MFKYLNKQIKKMDVWDIALTKWSVFFITIAVVKFFPQLLNLDYWLLIALGLALATKPMLQIFKK